VQAKDQESDMRACFRTIGAALAGLAIALPAAAQYPVRPVKIVVGFPPGSTPDLVSRAVAERMADDLGQAVIVENRPGAGSTIATEAVARSPADGYTLIVSGCSGDGIVYGFVMTGRPPFDPFRDFTPVGRVMRDHWVLAVSPALGIGSVDELVALGKSKPGSLTFPSPGTGTSQHLQAERFRMRVGLDATHVPYKDSPFPDLVAGRVTYAVQSSAAVVPLIKSGKLKGLAVLSTSRLASLPDVPTAAEAGLPDLIYNAGVCLYAPGGTPRDVVARLNGALNKAEASDAVKQRFADLGVEAVQGSPEDTAKFIAELMALVDQLRTAVFGKAR
jgi:tripartite-type tricarboxylate transporter receptor subunit TctC